MIRATHHTYLRGLLLAALLPFVCSFGFAKSTDRPNILIIMADDLGYADVGFNGSKDIPTPSLDALAAGGTICSSAFVAHPVCGPSRAAMLTGRFPHMLGGQFNIPYFNHHLGVSLEEKFLSTVLQEAGYYTGMFGKWHLGEGHDFLPNQRGFDEFYGHLGGGHKYFPEKYLPVYDRLVKAGETKIAPNTTPHWRNGKPERETEYLTDAFSREAVNFIQTAAKKDQPFFLYLPYNAPHAPIEAKQEDIDKMSHIPDPKRRKIAAMVHCLDYGVKRVVEALKETGEYENTLIIFLSDNGGVARLGSSNYPLAGEKRGVDEGGYRVPMFWHWPGKIPAGRTFEHPVLTLDFYPTLVNLVGATMPENKILDGKNIWDDFIAGENSHHGEMIYTMSHRDGYTDTSAMVNGWKVKYLNRKWGLFNLNEDLGETTDVRAQNPERFAQLFGQLEQWAQQHPQPKWFYDSSASVAWENNEHAYFNDTFDLSRPPGFSKKRSPTRAPWAITESSDSSKKRGSDRTLSDWMALEKAKADKQGWTFNSEKTKAGFQQMDTNSDGLLSGRERKLWYEAQNKKN